MTDRTRCLSIATRPEQPNFEVTTARVGSTAIVRATGELDLATVSQLEDAVEAARSHWHGRLVLDLRPLRFIDSSGVTLIVRLHRETGREGLGLVIAPGDGPVRTLLDLTGVSRHVALVDDPEARPARQRG
jgi:anti-anti-sigma factor